MKRAALDLRATRVLCIQDVGLPLGAMEDCWCENRSQRRRHSRKRGPCSYRKCSCSKERGQGRGEGLLDQDLALALDTARLDITRVSARCSRYCCCCCERVACPPTSAVPASQPASVPCCWRGRGRWHGEAQRAGDRRRCRGAREVVFGAGIDQA